MENDMLETPQAERPRLPPANIPGRDPLPHEVGERDASERNGVFRNLVTDDADIAGLVAYSIYKQNKLDWLAAFETAKGRAPNEAELASYIIGEGTPRRLATYRHLAEATLAGRGPDASGARVPIARSAFDRGGLAPTAIVGYAVALLVLLLGFWLALHYTVSTH